MLYYLLIIVAVVAPFLVAHKLALRWSVEANNRYVKTWDDADRKLYDLCVNTAKAVEVLYAVACVLLLVGFWHYGVFR